MKMHATQRKSMKIGQDRCGMGRGIPHTNFQRTTNSNKTQIAQKRTNQKNRDTTLTLCQARLGNLGDLAQQHGPSLQDFPRQNLTQNTSKVRPQINLESVWTTILDKNMESSFWRSILLPVPKNLNFDTTVGPETVQKHIWKIDTNTKQLSIT